MEGDWVGLIVVLRWEGSCSWEYRGIRFGRGLVYLQLCDVIPNL